MKRERFDAWMLRLSTLGKEDGQVLITVVFSTILILGMSGLSMDLGRAYYSYRELQSSTDAAALAGGLAMGQANATTTTVTAVVDQFSSAVTGSGQSAITGYNANPNLPGATVTTVNFSCNTTYSSDAPCAGPGGNNVVQVIQTATVNTMFLRVLSMMHVTPPQSLTLSATAFALMKGGNNTQYNVAVVVDSTGSMSSNDADGNCTGTREQCAMEGVQTLLAGLVPCSPGSTASNCKGAFDSVGLFVFPNFQASTATNATTCPVPKKGTNVPVSVPYSAPVPGYTWSNPSGSNPSYEITTSSSTNGFLDNYSSTNALNGSIATTSQLGIVTGADSSSCGLTTPISGQGTYLAGAIYAAQSALIAAQTANPGSKNALVILTDGDADAGTTFTNTSGVTLTSKTTPALHTDGTYPSMIDQCQQAIGAAQYAATNGTAVYPVAYGAGTSGCASDAKAYQDPCTNLQAMALQPGSSAAYPANFYSDATTKNKGACTSPVHPSLTLDEVFQSVAGSLTISRLIPN